MQVYVQDERMSRLQGCERVTMLRANGMSWIARNYDVQD